MDKSDIANLKYLEMSLTNTNCMGVNLADMREEYDLGFLRNSFSVDFDFKDD